MEKRLTCAVETNDSKFGKKQGVMCKHCSSANIDQKLQEPFWMCNKYNTRLTENNEKWLLRCEKCMCNGDS
jgi:hypothetical protein